MDVDGQDEAPAAPPTEAEIAHQETAPAPGGHYSMEQGAPHLEIPSTAPDEASGVASEVAQEAGEPESPDPFSADAVSGSRKRKPTAPNEPDTDGTPIARRGRSSVGAADSTAADSSAKKSKTAAKGPQVSVVFLAFFSNTYFLRNCREPIRSDTFAVARRNRFQSTYRGRRSCSAHL